MWGYFQRKFGAFRSIQCAPVNPGSFPPLIPNGTLNGASSEDAPHFDVKHLEVRAQSDAMKKAVQVAIDLLWKATPELQPLISQLIGEQRLSVRVVSSLKPITEALGLSDYSGASLTTPHTQGDKKHYELFLAEEHLFGLGFIIAGIAKQLHGIERSEKRSFIHNPRSETISLLSRSIRTERLLSEILRTQDGEVVRDQQSELLEIALQLEEVIAQDQHDLDELLGLEEVFADTGERFSSFDVRGGAPSKEDLF